MAGGVVAQPYREVVHEAAEGDLRYRFGRQGGSLGRGTAWAVSPVWDPAVKVWEESG